MLYAVTLEILQLSFLPRSVIFSKETMPEKCFCYFIIFYKIVIENNKNVKVQSPIVERSFVIKPY